MKNLFVILVLSLVAVIGTSRSSLFRGAEFDAMPEASGEETGVVTTGATDVPVVSGGAKPSAKPDVTTSSGTAPLVSGTNSALPLADQSAGTIVTVRSVTFDAPGWVAVHDGVTGEPGNTMGASWLPAGTRENVTVELLRPMIAGNKYFLVLHSDDGDKVYNSKIDLALAGSIPFAFTAK